MTKSQELIVKLKQTKKRNNITYNAILDELTVNGIPLLSLTTIRRVFASDSEHKASSFNYEETLLPISDALNRLAGADEDAPQKKEIEALNNMIRIQGDAIDRMVLSKEQLISKVDAYAKLISEKDALITRLIDRLDQKDEIIRQFILDLKEKDRIIHDLMRGSHENAKGKNAPVRQLQHPHASRRTGILHNETDRSGVQD